MSDIQDIRALELRITDIVNDFIMKRFVNEWNKATDGRKNDNRIRIIPAPPDA